MRLERRRHEGSFRGRPLVRFAVGMARLFARAERKIHVPSRTPIGVAGRVEIDDAIDVSAVGVYARVARDERARR